MATYTPNYNLSKPDENDSFGDFRASYNANMGIIDANLGGGGGGGDTVSWTQIQATGEKIAEITINGTTTDVLIPFEAKIIVTTTTGLTVTATKGGTTYTATETSSGVYEVIVDSKGTWTVTDGTNTTTVSVTAQTTYNVAFVVIPDGSTVTPTDDIQTWLHCANIWDKNYTTLAEVLADSTTLSALISDNNATDYLVRSTTWASGMCPDSTAMTYIGLNNYCANKLLADSTWRTAICNSTYFESVLNVKVPVMTSNTTPSGTASGTTTETGDYYKAFDRSGDYWYGQPANPEYVQYDFGRLVRIYKLYMNVRGISTAARTWNVKYQGSDDNVTYSDMTESFDTTSITTSQWYEDTRISNVTTPVRSVRFVVNTNYYTPLITILQFHGREDV